jgi:hypothetical protein
MIGEPNLPNIMPPVESPARPEGESALDILHCSFKTLFGRDHSMEMVRHDDISMKQIRLTSVMLKNFLHQ